MADDLSLNTLRGPSTTLLAKMALAKLSEELVASPAARSNFVKDPAGYLRARFGQELTGDEQKYFSALARMYADGNCCNGCNCSPTALTAGTLVRTTP